MSPIDLLALLNAVDWDDVIQCIFLTGQEYAVTAADHDELSALSDAVDAVRQAIK